MFPYSNTRNMIVVCKTENRLFLRHPARLRTSYSTVSDILCYTWRVICESCPSPVETPALLLGLSSLLNCCCCILFCNLLLYNHIILILLLDAQQLQRTSGTLSLSASLKSRTRQKHQYHYGTGIGIIIPFQSSDIFKPI